MPQPFTRDGRCVVYVGLVGVGSQARHPIEGGRWLAYLLPRPGQEGLAAEKLHVPANAHVVDSSVWDDGRVHGVASMADALHACRPDPHEPRPRPDVAFPLLRPLASRLFLGEMTPDHAEAFFRAEHPRVLASSWA